MQHMSELDLARLPTARSRSDLSIAAHAAASGAICVLRKPLESSTLIDCLKKALKVRVVLASCAIWGTLPDRPACRFLIPRAF